MERVVRTLPPVVIDCSDWPPEIPAEVPAQTATFMIVKRILTPFEVVVCHRDSLAPESEPQLTVSVQFEDGELSDSFVRAIYQSDPTVRLEREPSTVVLTVPNHSAVAALFGALRDLEAAGCVIGSEQGAFHVRRKAS